MYTKTGLGLLAAAGLVFGVIGMHAGGASPASTANGCARTSSPGGSASGSATVPTTPTTRSKTRTNGPGNRNGGGPGAGTSGQGALLTVDSSGLRGGGAGTVTVPNPASGGGNSGGSGSPAAPFLDVNGASNGTVLPGGGGSVPPANGSIDGRSQYLSRLLQLYANANANR